jgi:hypothetical protein
MATTTSAPFADLTAALRGDLVTPVDEGYDVARAVYNGMIDKRPAAVARCRDVADVIAAVAFARAHGLEIAVRGGGHHAAGFGTWDDALVVDLSPMRSTTVDPEQRTVRVDGGATWGDVDHATVAFGLATPSGFLASTGVGGLALGGGIGYLSRRFGLTVDNLLAADVVLADGRFVTASATSHPELFWALRGGGGNFGVVTSFTFRCHPIGEHGTVIGGPVLYDIADAPVVMRWYRELMPALPEELSGWLGLITIPPAPPFPEELWGRKACAIVWCYTGPHDRADNILAPVREYGSPLVVGLHDMPFTALQSAFALPGRAAVVLARRLLPGDQRRRDRRAPRVRGAAPDRALHDAPLPDRRRRRPRRAGRHRLRLSRRRLGGRHRRGRPRPRPGRTDLGLGEGVLGAAAPHLGRQRIPQLRHGRGHRPGACVLPRQLRAADGDQAPLRPRQHVPPQPEHPACRAGLKHHRTYRFGRIARRGAPPQRGDRS